MDDERTVAEQVEDLIVKRYTQKELDENIEAAEEAGAADERAACAEIARAQGCLCQRSGEKPSDWIGLLTAEHEPRASEGGELPQLLVKAHNPKCPQAIAQAIAARGRQS